MVVQGNHIQAIQLIVALLSNTTTAQQEEDDLSLIKGGCFCDDVSIIIY